MVTCRCEFGGQTLRPLHTWLMAVSYFCKYYFTFIFLNMLFFYQRQGNLEELSFHICYGWSVTTSLTFSVTPIHTLHIFCERGREREARAIAAVGFRPVRWLSIARSIAQRPVEICSWSMKSITLQGLDKKPQSQLQVFGSVIHYSLISSNLQTLSLRPQGDERSSVSIWSQCLEFRSPALWLLRIIRIWGLWFYMIMAGRLTVANFNFEMKHAKCRGYVMFLHSALWWQMLPQIKECPKRVAKRHSMWLVPKTRT